MKTNTGFAYAYNAQAVVDDTHQVIIAIDVTQQATDVQQFVPMVEVMDEQLVQAGIPGHASVFLADAGYFSKRNIAQTQEHPSRMLIATGRERARGPHSPAGELLPTEATARQQMAYELSQPDGRAHYARRKAIVEPVFGQMKTRQNAGQLRLRGKAAASAEWALHAACHNLRKLRTGLAHAAASTGKATALA